MLTSEYVALDGALVLALPTKLGQDFYYEVLDNHDSIVIWEAFHQDKAWLSLKLNYQNWEVLETNLPEAADFVVKLLRNCQQLSGSCFQKNDSYHFRTNLQFPPDYGLGSSSTLINNLAEWANVDAFELSDISLGGSGYDIAVAKEKSAILFQNLKGNRIYEKIDFRPSFSNELLFIHLNQKQNSREGIQLYQSKPKSPELINEFSILTRAIIESQDLEKFSHLMTIHEEKLSNFLNIKTSKEKFFENCPSFIKSLGAWGGDFVMSSKFEGYRAWFSERGFDTVFSYNDLIL